MARTRDIVAGVIIAVTFLVAVVVVIVMIAGVSEEGDGFSGLGSGNVGIVDMAGVIDEESAKPVIKQLDKWASAGSIKAIIVRVDSPGGVVAPSQEIYDAMIRAKKKKPIVVSMASVAASGGYYISCAATKIVADPGTITGSIGVIFQFHTFKGLMDKVGIGSETVKSGELKDVGSYSRPMTEKEQKMLQSVIMDTYEQFVQVVAAGRGKEKTDVYPLADGSIFTGLQAYNLGLVDTLGGLQQAIELAGKLGNIEGEPSVVRPQKKEKLSILDIIGQFTGTLRSGVSTPFSGPQLLFLYQ